MGIQQISVLDLKKKLDAKENFVLVDCREPDEYEIAKIEGSCLIPLSDFENRAAKELKVEDNIVIHCHHGGRSHRACQYLASIGYRNLSNVLGGIDAWAQEIDPDVGRY